MGFYSRLFYFLAVLCTCLTGHAAQTPAEPSLPAYSRQTQLTDISIIRGIINYTRWPNTPNPLQACILDEHLTSNKKIQIVQYLARALPTEWEAEISIISSQHPTASNLAHCHLLYINSLPLEKLQQIVREIAEKPILTIAQESDACSAGIMFCLVDGPKTRFIVNLDATARSALRINPQVLRLSYRPPVTKQP